MYSIILNNLRIENSFTIIQQQVNVYLFNIVHVYNNFQ